MSAAIDTFLFAVFPYIALALFLLGTDASCVFLLFLGFREVAVHAALDDDAAHRVSEALAIQARGLTDTRRLCAALAPAEDGKAAIELDRPTIALVLYERDLVFGELRVESHGSDAVRDCKTGQVRRWWLPRNRSVCQVEVPTGDRERRRASTT